jgi:hypothetical protein
MSRRKRLMSLSLSVTKRQPPFEWTKRYVKSIHSKYKYAQLRNYSERHK